MAHKGDRGWLLRDVRGKRLRRLIPGVWNRLPTRDRAVLRRRLTIVEGDAGLGLNDLAGTCWEEGLGQDFAGGYRIKFRPSVNADETLPDEFVRFLIAHEFAHAVLSHCRIGALVLRLEKQRYEREWSGIGRAFSWLQEEHAAEQLAEWGFLDELRALRANAERLAEQNPDARRAIPLCIDRLLERAAARRPPGKPSEYDVLFEEHFGRLSSDSDTCAQQGLGRDDGSRQGLGQ